MNKLEIADTKMSPFLKSYVKLGKLNLAVGEICIFGD